MRWHWPEMGCAACKAGQPWRCKRFLAGSDRRAVQHLHRVEEPQRVEEWECQLLRQMKKCKNLCCLDLLTFLQKLDKKYIYIFIYILAVFHYMGK